MEKVFTSPHVDAMILDGAAMVHMIKPGAAKTFRAYAENVFIPSLADRLLTISRVDVVFDTYTNHANSLKRSLRENVGVGKGS